MLASRRPQLATPVALGLALVVCTATYAGAISFNLANAERTKTDVLGPDPSFVDSTGIEGAAMLQSRSSQRAVASEYLFWNRSVDAVYLLPGAEPPDSFAVTRLTTAADGTLLANGRPVTEPLVADGFSDTIRFRDSDEIATSPVYRLVASPGPQRLALYAPGRYEDGWLGLVGSFQLWPESAADGLAGTLRFELTGAGRLAAGRGSDRAAGRAGQGDRRAAGRDRAGQHPGLRVRALVDGLRRALDQRDFGGASSPCGRRSRPTGQIPAPVSSALDAVLEPLRLRQGLELLQRVVLDLADALARDAERAADLLERPRLLALEAEAELDHLALALGQRARAPGRCPRGGG